MPKDLILPLSVLMASTAFGLIAKWYVWPLVRWRPMATALVPLLLFHSFRFVGLAFLIPGVTSEPLDPRFANPAAYGDLVAALLALLGILALRRGWRTAIPLVWVFNVEGTLDLLYAVMQGLRYTEDGTFGATFFIPMVVVPALLVSHVLMFVMLVKGERILDERRSGGQVPKES